MNQKLDMLQGWKQRVLLGTQLWWSQASFGRWGYPCDYLKQSTWVEAIQEYIKQLLGGWIRWLWRSQHAYWTSNLITGGWDAITGPDCIWGAHRARWRTTKTQSQKIGKKKKWKKKIKIKIVKTRSLSLKCGPKSTHISC